MIRPHSVCPHSLWGRILTNLKLDKDLSLTLNFKPPEKEKKKNLCLYRELPH